MVPYRDKKAYDLLIQSESGFLSITGTPEAPAKAGISIADISAGMYAYSNILAALIQRGKTGQRLPYRFVSARKHGGMDELSALLRIRRRSSAPAYRRIARDHLSLRPFRAGDGNGHAWIAERTRMESLLRIACSKNRNSPPIPDFLPIRAAPGRAEN